MCCGSKRMQFRSGVAAAPQAAVRPAQAEPANTNRMHRARAGAFPARMRATAAAQAAERTMTAAAPEPAS